MTVLHEARKGWKRFDGLTDLNAVDFVLETVRTVNEQGVKILLVEQRAARALSTTVLDYVLETKGTSR